MKIVLLPGMYANLPPVEACLKNIEEQKSDVVYCLGDRVGYNSGPSRSNLSLDEFYPSRQGFNVGR